jgi:thiamine pyrophosphokinase
MDVDDGAILAFMKRTKRQAVLLANGTAPPKQLAMKYIRHADLFICADGGANTAVRWNLAPQLILGDLDSVTEQSLKRFSHVTIKRIRDQNSTDLEKALSYLLQHRYSHAVVLGATGGRADHEWSNFSALAKFSDSLNILFVDRYGEYFFIENDTVIHMPIGGTISLLPLTVCKGVTTSGLKWNLKDESLGLGVRESTSNVAKAEIVSIKFRTGKMVVFFSHSIKKPEIIKSRIHIS